MGRDGADVQLLGNEVQPSRGGKIDGMQDLPRPASALKQTKVRRQRNGDLRLITVHQTLDDRATIITAYCIIAGIPWEHKVGVFLPKTTCGEARLSTSRYRGCSAD